MARINEKHGGAREGAGRKPDALKAELQTLLERAWPLAKRRKALKAIAEKAEQGDLDALKILLDRAYGKPTEHKTVGAEDGGPLKIIVEYGSGREDTDDPPA